MKRLIAGMLVLAGLVLASPVVQAQSVLPNPGQITIGVSDWGFNSVAYNGTSVDWWNEVDPEATNVYAEMWPIGVWTTRDGASHWCYMNGSGPTLTVGSYAKYSDNRDGPHTNDGVDHIFAIVTAIGVSQWLPDPQFGYVNAAMYAVTCSYNWQLDLYTYYVALVDIPSCAKWCVVKFDFNENRPDELSASVIDYGTTLQTCPVNMVPYEFAYGQ